MINELLILNKARTSNIEKLCDELKEAELTNDEIRLIKKTTIELAEDKRSCDLLGFNYRKISDDDLLRMDYIAYHMVKKDFNIARLYEQIFG